jgi:hypothetical protein
MYRSLTRRLVALAAAYAVALSALLPVSAALVSPAAGAVGLAVICSGGADSPGDRGVPQKPQPTDPCCGACAMPGCGAAALPPLVSVEVGVIRADAAPLARRRDGERRQTFWPGDGNLARGPPLA